MAPPVMAHMHPFDTVPCLERRLSLNLTSPDLRWAGIPLAPLYVGAAAIQLSPYTVEIGISIHDGSYTVDFCVTRIQVKADGGETLEEAIKLSIVQSIDEYSHEHHSKFVGAGITDTLAELCPDICAHLWRKLDIVVLKFEVQTNVPRSIISKKIRSHHQNQSEVILIGVDEQADSAVRKCIMHFGPNHNPALTIEFRNRVEPDAGGRIELVHDLKEYQDTVHPGTWNTVLKFSDEIRDKNVKVAFFSATPQGGGVALMRHALIRFFRLLDVDVDWYIPKPNPKVFRITKTNHNILQGVADPQARLDDQKKQQITDWITYNAERYWFSEGGPLAQNGADVVVIDDPQMPGLIPLIRKARPEVKIIYRSHIEIRTDLVRQPGSPQEEVWRYLWAMIKLADVFISHPVDKFVPSDVPMSMVGLMPACTDWLDGLNKELRDWDLRFYHHDVRNSCNELGMNLLLYPAREYIVQIARFDPSKGIPDVIESYRKLCKRLVKEVPNKATPQLLICGHSAIDDPDGSIIYNQVLKLLEDEKYESVVNDIIVMRIGPSDQILNSLLTCSKIALQLSLREGFEVKASEALHHNKPVIATRAGGIGLQIRHGISGFLVDVGDTDKVADHLFDLYTDDELYERMSKQARGSVSDEVGTVGNAACWLYLAAALARGEGAVKPNGRWITDMARGEAGQGYAPGEPKLPRGGIDVKGDGHRGTA